MVAVRRSGAQIFWSNEAEATTVPLLLNLLLKMSPWCPLSCMIGACRFDDRGGPCVTIALPPDPPNATRS